MFSGRAGALLSPLPCNQGRGGGAMELSRRGVFYGIDQSTRWENQGEKIGKENQAFNREDVTPEKAKQILHDQSQRFKDEIIDELACAGEKSVSIYRQGDFTDLCRGPHIPSTAKIKAFKLQSVA